MVYCSNYPIHPVLPSLEEFSSGQLSVYTPKPPRVAATRPARLMNEFDTSALRVTIG